MSKAVTEKPHRIDLTTLTPAERKRVQAALSPRTLARRDFTLSLHFKKCDVDGWKEAARSEGTTLTACIEEQMTAWAAAVMKRNEKK